MTLLPPTVKQQKAIDEELPPNPEMRKQDIKAIREWLAKQPHLPKHMDDRRLEMFLFSCKNSVERCKMILERYFSARTALPEFFANRDPLLPEIQSNCDCVQYFVLPSLTEEGHRVTVMRVVDRALDKFSMEALTKRTLMAMEARLLEEASLSNVMIFDLEGFTAAHLAKCSPANATGRRAMLARQTCMPFRLHRVHYINAPSFINNALHIICALLKEKLVQKFRIHTGGYEALYPYIVKETLPNEWGGKAGTFKELNDAWTRKIEKYRDWYLREDELSRTDENARLPTSVSAFANELGDTQGSFRNLNFD